VGRCVGPGRGLGLFPVAGSFADRGYGFGLRAGAAAIVWPAETGAFTKLLAELAEKTRHGPQGDPQGGPRWH
jgi:hypothetical protein